MIKVYIKKGEMVEGIREEEDGYDAYDDDNKSPEEPCCSACGNPSYPKCKDGCPLFDD